jgi:hypothetical protein
MAESAGRVDAILCTGCQKSLPASSFPHFNGRRHGAKCFECKAQYHRAYHHANRDEVLRKLKLYRATHKEEMSAKKKECYLRRRKHYIDKAASWAAKNRTKRRKTALAWNKRNPDCIKETRRRMIAELRDCYVRCVLKRGGWSGDLIDACGADLVALKRAQLQLLRATKGA